MVTPTTQSISQPTERQPLRRATYVHVSDLISVYNIDHIQLEREIARVNTKRSKDLHPSGASPTSSDTIATGKTEISLASEGIDDSTRDGSSDGIPAPDEDVDTEEDIIPQKRLQPPRGGFNLCVLVGDINLVVDKQRVDQSRVRLAEVEIGDETGTVSLRARDEQIDLLERVRSKGKPRAVVLRNCTLELYQGKHIRLAVTKWGKITEYPDNVASTPAPPPTMNLDRNFSFIDLSLVASEIAEKEQSPSLPYASAASITTSNRQTNNPDSKGGKTNSSPSGKSTKQNKQRQSNTKHQHQHHNTRRNEQRRQSPSTSQYGGLKVDTNQPSSSSQMMYHGIQGYHGYGEHSMDIHMRQHYPPHTSYVHSQLHSQSPRQPDAVSAQYALHQQYEMQQRQMHLQLYQNRQTDHFHQQQQPSPMALRFDASTGSYTGDISMPSDHGTNLNPGYYSNSPKIESQPGWQDDDRPTDQHYPSMGTSPPYRIGKMNPKASSFAPSYLSAAQGMGSQQQASPIPPTQPYNSYNPSQQQQQQHQALHGASIYPTLQSAHHSQLYMPTTLSPGAYHPAMSRTGFDAAIEHNPSGDPNSLSSHQYYQYPPLPSSARDTAPSTSGKENVKSKP